jgi:hypothetical protein
MLAEKLILANGVKKLEAKISLIIVSFPKNTGRNIMTTDIMKM